MTIAIDMVGTDYGSGTKTYNLNFCKHLKNCFVNEKVYIFITKNYLDKIDSFQNINIKFIVKPSYYKYIFFRIIWMQVLLPFELKKLNVNKLFSPMNMGPLLIKFFGIKFILGLHSNLPWVYFSMMPGNYLRKLLTKFLMEISILNCDVLVVNSNYAKREIIKYIKIKESKIFVIYLGVDKKFLQNSFDKKYLPNIPYDNYIFSVMSCVRYHNVIKVLQAFKLLRNKNKKDLKFIIVLQVLDKKYFKLIKKFIKKNSLTEDIFILHNLQTDYLVNLYRYAKIYLFSSYCEVFGLTSLEAMSQGCPVLISNRSALREINSDAAQYFDPDNEYEIEQSIYKILNNSFIRNEIISKGTQHYKKFSWNKTVNETLKLLIN